MTRSQLVSIVMVIATAVMARVGDAQVQVLAALSSDTVYVGDGLRLEVQVAGSKDPERPRVPTIDGAVVEFAGGQDTSRRSIMIVNGRRTEEAFEGYVFSFRVLPTKPGRFEVPPIVVKVDGREYKSNAVAFTAVEAGEAEGFKLTVEAQKTKVYVGEPVPLRITWYMTEEVNGGTFSMPPADGAFELLPAPSPTGTRGQEFTLFGKPATAVQGQGTLDGVPCDTISVDRVFVARRAGNVTVGPMRLAFDVVLSRGFFGRADRKVLMSNPVSFEVLPLPTPQPPGFNGLIGEYEVGARASATDVHVGDPITLTVMVRGPEPLEAVPAMDLSRQAAFSGSFRMADEAMLPSVVSAGGGRVVLFTTTLRAERENVTEIPPVELSYFNVKTGRYGTARSDPIKLNVKATTEVGLPADLSAPDKPAPVVEESVGGLAPLVRSADALERRSFDLEQALRSPVAIGVVGGPAVLYLGSAGLMALRRRSERDPARRRQRGAAGRAERRIGRSGGDTTKIEGALRGFVADWFDVPEAGITSAECVDRLEQAGAASSGEFAAMVEACDATLYAGASARGDGGGGRTGVSSAEASALVKQLTRELEERE